MKSFFVSVKQKKIYLFFILTTYFGQLITIRPSPQNSKQGATQCKQYFYNMGAHKTYKILLTLYKLTFS